MYQLIGITIDFLAFNTITKIDVKSNENDFNYPFITLTVKADYKENYNMDLILATYNPLQFQWGNMHPYDRNCNKSIMWQRKVEFEFIWKINYMLNCKPWKFFTLLNWDHYYRKFSKMTRNVSKSKLKFGWSITNAPAQQLMLSYVTSKINVEIRKSRIIDDIFHHDNNEFNLKNVLLHSQPIPHLNDLSYFNVEFKSNNNSLIIRKILRSYLEPPFGNCSHYSNNDLPFNARSYLQCYRRCLISFARTHIGCHPVFIDFSISELDLEPNEEYNKTNVCLYDKYLEFEEKRKTLQLSQKCVNLCPKDCLTVDYFYDILETDSLIRNDFWHQLNESEKYSKNSLIWDSTQPMFEYKEVGVMSFTDYLSSFGGY